MARAAASKAGPRFAEVAGRARCSEAGLLFLVFLGIRARSVGFLCLLQRSDHGVQRGIKDDGRMAEWLQRGAFALVHGALKEIAAVEFHGEVGILEQVSGEDQDDSFRRLHETLLQQFFQASEGDGGGGLAANAFGADFGFGLSDLEFAYLFAGATRSLKNFYRLFPRSGVADADRGGTSLSLHADEMLAPRLTQSAKQCVGAFRLNHGQLREPR